MAVVLRRLLVIWIDIQCGYLRDKNDTYAYATRLRHVLRTSAKMLHNLQLRKLANALIMSTHSSISVKAHCERAQCVPVMERSMEHRERVCHLACVNTLSGRNRDWRGHAHELAEIGRMGPVCAFTRRRVRSLHINSCSAD